MFYLMNKHPHRYRRLTSAGRSFITCDVTTDDGATLYVYVSVYAAIHCRGKSGRAPRLNPSALLIAVSSRVRNYATEKRLIGTVESRSGWSLASISI